MFYEFDNAELKAFVDQQIAKCQHENECIMWLASLRNDRPGCLKIDNGIRQGFDLKRLIFQLCNPDVVLAKNKSCYSVESSCDKLRCIAKDHLQLVEPKDRWDPAYLKDRLQKNSAEDPTSTLNGTACVLWTGALNGPYGYLKVYKKKLGAHVLSLMLKDGLREEPPKKDGVTLLARHRCLNKTCIEPTHLEWGTHSDNAQDKIRDGTSLTGERNPAAKISEALAQKIKSSWRPQGHAEYQSQSQRASYFGVSYGTVEGIDSCRSWKHLQGPRDGETSGENLDDAPGEAGCKEDWCMFVEDFAIATNRILERSKLIENLSKDPEISSPCCVFQGGLRNGYGRMSYKGKNISVHVVVAENALGRALAEKEVVRHLCGNKSCVATDHLLAGTRSENALDAIIHGDLKFQLTIADIHRIRNFDMADKAGLEKIALEYGVRVRHLKDIACAKYWGWVQDSEQSYEYS